VTPEPTPSPDPQPAGHDIGLSFRLCHVNTWRNAPIDGDVMEVRETAFVLREGAFDVVDTIDYETSVNDPIPNVSDAPACGVDWQLWD
jgi:hypothetical protein